MQNKNNNQQNNADRAISFVVVIIAILVTVVMHSNGVNLFLSVIASTALTFLLLMIIVGIRGAGNSANKQNALLTKEVAFYQECERRGIKHPLGNPVDFEKMKLMAQSMPAYKKYSDDKLREMYVLGASQIDTNKENAAAEQKRKARESDIETKMILEKYAGLIGREKRLTMIKEEVDLAKRGMDAYEYIAKNGFEAEKEHSWGIAGGVAQAIGGVGAGVMAAATTEQENERIRQRNAETYQARMEGKNAAKKEAGRMRTDWAHSLNQMKKTEVAMVTDVLPESVADQFVTGRVVSMKATGGESLEITAEVKGTGREMTVRGLKALLDGSLCAQVSRQGAKVDDCRLVLPMWGVKADQTLTLKGMCTNANFTSADISSLSVTIKPDRTWLIEE